MTKLSYAYWLLAQDIAKKKRAEREASNVEDALAGPADIQSLIDRLDPVSFDDFSQAITPAFESPQLPVRPSVPAQAVLDGGMSDSLPKVRIQKRSRLQGRDSPRNLGEHFL